jgi:PiT family inorganic phosphate transporter
MNVLLWVVFGILTAFFVAWNNGSNNAPNSIGTAVGAGVLSTRKALVIASIASFAGALSLGIYVTSTVMKGIVNITVLGTDIVVKGMIAVLIAAGIWTLISTFLEVPMSVHVCIIGGILGFGLATGASLISWGTVIKIFIAWVISPFAAAVLAYALYHAFNKSFSDPGYAKISVIITAYITVATPTILILLKSAALYDILFDILVTIVISTLLALFTYVYWDGRVKRGGDPVHEASRILLIMAAVSMAFSFGSNDIGNSAGPLAAIFYALRINNNILGTIWLSIIISATGLSTGIIMWGEKIIGTIGERITPLSPLTAYTAQIAATITMLIVSRLGLPVSTSMTIIGGVMGVGLSKGVRNVNLKLIARIFGVWLIALPLTMTLGYFLTVLFIDYVPS